MSRGSSACGASSKQPATRSWSRRTRRDPILCSSKELPDADVVISQPFWPGYLTAERIAKAPNLRLAITAGIGSDHVDLNAAIARGVTVAEVTFCNSISVSEHAVMQILALVRDFLPSHEWVANGGWNIADSVERSYDLEGMSVGHPGRRPDRARRAAASGALRRRPALQRQAPPSREVEQDLGLTFHPDAQSLARSVDVLSIHSPLVPETYQLFDDELIGSMRRGSYIVNTARGAIMDRDAVVRALESGQLAGYAGDVWYPQPPPADHPWRTMPHNAMTPHTSGTTLSAQARYAAGTREILEDFFAGRPIRQEYLIVDGGRLAGTGAASYCVGRDRQPGQQRPVASFLRAVLYGRATPRAWSRGRITTLSMSTWLGRVATKAMTSATSSAVSGVRPW